MSGANILDGVKDEQYNKDPQAKTKESHHHHHEEEKDKSAILYLLADFLHNAIDGVAIGVAFGVSKLLIIPILILRHQAWIGYFYCYCSP